MVSDVSGVLIVLSREMPTASETPTRTERFRPSGNALVFAGHVLVAAFISLLRYPCTQDGPAHAYTVHILRALFRDPTSIYHRYFTASIRPAANGLFFYFGIWAGDFMSLEHVVSLTFFVALTLLPLSALAFTGALRATTPNGRALPSLSAWALACPLAYSYFLYRGLFNFSLGISLTFFTLAAVVVQGAHLRTPIRILFGVLAILSAGLAAFAHASAIAFLFFAMPVACLGPRRPFPVPRALAGIAVWIVLFIVSQASHVSHDGPPDPQWWAPWTALEMFVRAFGVTQSYFEVVPAITLIAVLSLTAARFVPQLRDLRARYAELWPIALSLSVAGGYFVVPNVVSEISGVNERLPLFAAMLLIPFVPATGRIARSLAIAALPFGIYVAAINAKIESRVRALRDAGSNVAIEKGAIVFPAVLDLKLGSVSADLGRYLIADIARRHDAVTGNLFYGHPVFPVQGTKITPSVPNPTPVQDFAHLNAIDQSAALADPHSAIHGYFRESRLMARGARYVIVIPYAPLDAAYRENVLDKLGAKLATGSSEILPIYELPP